MYRKSRYMYNYLQQHVLFYQTINCMAIGWRTNIEQTKDNKLRYLEEDNVVNITKNNLTSLQSSLQIDQEQDLDAKLTVINDHVEKYFNWFLIEERDNNITLIVNWANITDTVKNIIMSWDKTRLNALGNYVIDQSKYEWYVDKIKDEEIKTVLKNYEFELNDLWKNIESSGVQPTRNEEIWNTLHTDITDSDTETNPDKQDIKGKKTKEKKTKKENIEQPDVFQDYSDPYQNIWYVTPWEELYIENIYKDNKIRKSLERIFDKETEKELHKGTFKINLSVEDGLASIVIAIREALIVWASEETPEEGSETNAQKLYTYLSDNNLLPDDEETDSLKIEKKHIKELMELWLIDYERAGWLDLEKSKVAKVLSNAKRVDLDEFASLLQSKPDIAMAVKEWNNTLEMTGNSRSDEYKEWEQKTLVNSDNVLSFLCDYNSDGQISAAYYKNSKKARKNREAQTWNKLQENQWDVGTLFGQQIFFTIEQAIKVKNIELGESKWEQLVISNIIKNIQIADSRNLTEDQRTMLDSMSELQNCTRENLVKLIHGDEDSNISSMPTFKIYFLDAIKKINGGSNEINLDLYDTLTKNNNTDVLFDFYNNEINIENKIDQILTESKDPKIQQLIKEKTLIRVRETVLTKIMSFVNWIELTLNDGTRTTVWATGITKTREAGEIKNELLEKIWKDLVSGGITISPTWSITLSLGIGQSWTSQSGRTKRWRSIWSAVTLWTDGVLLEVIGVSWEIAEQYNYNKVINADLSKIKSAKYIGLEWHLWAWVSFQWEASVWVIGNAWLTRQWDLETWINQIDKQYTAISKEIFGINNVPVSILSNEKNLTDYFTHKIVEKKHDGIFGKFVIANEQHLIDNMNFIIKYMKLNNFFWDKWIIKTYPEATTLTSMKTLISILQAGNIDLWRHNIIADLHGKISLTKLSFGFTSSFITLGKSSTEEPAPTPSATTWETLDAGDNNIKTGGISSQNNTWTDKYWALFMYVWARVSTWRNMYASNVPQYLFTQYETGQGVGTEYINNPTKDLDTYGKYLIALYNDQKNRLSYSVDTGRLILNFTPEKWSELTLAKFLNIHATTKAQEWFSLKGNTLIMGNVGDIWAYTITEAKGVRRILSLGTKKLDEATRVTGNNATTTVEAMKPVEESNKEWTQEKIQTNIIPNMTGTWKHVETAKTDSALFFDSEGKLTKPAQKTVTFEPTSIEGTKITTGTLLIRKNTDNESFTVKLDGTTPTDKLTITYLDQTEYEHAYNAAILNINNLKPVKSFTVDRLFSFDWDKLKAQRLLTTISNDIKDLEKNTNLTNKTEYLEFLSSASNIIDSDWYINDTEINKAIEYLKVLLPNTTTTLSELRGYLDSTDRSTKTYIVDRLKQIFAKDAWYTGKTLSYIIGQHTGWEAVTWPSDTELPKDLLKEMKTQRNTVWSKSKQTYSESPTINPNLIWYTAFYRYTWTHYKNVKFSMTSLGNTSSQVDLYTITENKEQARERFLGNLEKNQYEVENLATALEAKFAAQWTTADIQKDTYEETFKTVKSLLKWDTILLDSWGKISIDVNWVFYLLGECCNESIWVEISKIHTQDIKDNITINWKYSASGTPDKDYKWWIDVHYKSHSISSHVSTKEQKVWAKFITWPLWKEKAPTAESHSWDDPTPGSEWAPSNDTPSWWETTEWWTIDIWSWWDWW